MLTEAQVVALEKAKTKKEAHGEFESEHPGYYGAQDTFYVGKMNGVGRVYQQTFIDTYAKVACAKLYDRKTPITAVDLLNDRVLPIFDEHDVKLLRVLTDRGCEYCGNPEWYEYELYLALIASRSLLNTAATNLGASRRLLFLSTSHHPHRVPIKTLIPVSTAAATAVKSAAHALSRLCFAIPAAAFATSPSKEPSKGKCRLPTPVRSC